MQRYNNWEDSWRSPRQGWEQTQGRGGMWGYDRPVDWRPYGRAWHPPIGNGVYLFIRFPEAAVEHVAQATVLSRRSAATARGEFVGIARKVHDLSSGPRRPEALVVYLFESTDAAKRFFVSDPRFKQPDFPPPYGLAESWTVVKYLSTRDESEYTTYMMGETRLRYATYTDFKSFVATPLAALIIEYGGQPFVVQSIGVDALRRQHIGDNVIVTVHLFRTDRDVKAMMDDDRFLRLKEIQDGMAEDSTSVFTIDPDACP